jgi:hypothetical protein
MNSGGRLDRAAMELGAVSIISAGFVFVQGDFQIVQIGGAGLVVALVLGSLAVVAGWFNERTLMLAAGAGFLLAAAVQLSLLAGGSSGLLGGNASTFSLWLGLGIGLVAIGMGVPRPEPAEEASYETY